MARSLSHCSPQLSPFRIVCWVERRILRERIGAGAIVSVRAARVRRDPALARAGCCAQLLWRGGKGRRSRLQLIVVRVRRFLSLAREAGSDPGGRHQGGDACVNQERLHPHDTLHLPSPIGCTDGILETAADNGSDYGKTGPSPGAPAIREDTTCNGAGMTLKNHASIPLPLSLNLTRTCRKSAAISIPQDY